MGKFIISAVATGFTFKLNAGNGETIATSQVYKTLDTCQNGAESVKKTAPDANLEDQTTEGFETAKHPKFELYKDSSEQFRFRLKASNGEKIAASEGYTSKAACLNGIASVRRNAPDAAIILPEEK